MSNLTFPRKGAKRAWLLKTDAGLTMAPSPTAFLFDTDAQALAHATAFDGALTTAIGKLTPAPPPPPPPPPPPATNPLVAINLRVEVGTTSVRFLWDADPTDAVTGWLAGRDGTDSTGYGPWQTPTPLAKTVEEITFTNLVPGQTYGLWVEPVGGERALAAVTVPAVAPPPPAPDPVPAGGNPIGLSSRWGVYQDGLNAQSVASYDAWLGRPTGIVLRYNEERDMPREAIPGKVSMWSPKWRMDVPTPTSVIQAYGNYLVASGQANSVIRQAWEPNGSWMAWWYFHLIGQAAWVQRFREVVAILRAIPGQNFRFEWNVNITVDESAAYTETFYPGDDVVDIIGMDVYSKYGAPTWKTGSVGLDWLKGMAARHGKPFGFSEYGVFPGVNDPLFMQTILPFIKDPQCAYALYFEGTDDGLGVSFSMQGGASTQSATLLRAAAKAAA